MMGMEKGRTFVGGWEGEGGGEVEEVTMSEAVEGGRGIQICSTYF